MHAPPRPQDHVRPLHPSQTLLQPQPLPRFRYRNRPYPMQEQFLIILLPSARVHDPLFELRYRHAHGYTHPALPLEPSEHIGLGDHSREWGYIRSGWGGRRPCGFLLLSISITVWSGRAGGWFAFLRERGGVVFEWRLRCGLAFPLLGFGGSSGSGRGSSTRSRRTGTSCGGCWTHSSSVSGLGAGGSAVEGTRLSTSVWTCSAAGSALSEQGGPRARRSGARLPRGRKRVAAASGR